jgi:hypothetical protein
MNKLKKELKQLIGKTISEKDIEFIICLYKQQHKADLIYIEKLKRKRIFEIKRINGGLKQAISAHGAITKQLIGSASKRIYGALLSNKKEFSFLDKIIKYICFWGKKVIHLQNGKN